MPWKTTDEGGFETVNGNPVWVDDEGQETPFDYATDHAARISRLNAESQDRRKRLKELSDNFEPWSALDLTPDEVSESLAELRRLKKAAKRAKANGDGNDPDAEALQARIAELEDALEERDAKIGGSTKQLETLTGERDTLTATVNRLTVGRDIRNSKWFSKVDGNDPLSRLHPDIAEEQLSPFGRPGEDGKVTWYRDREHESRILNEKGEPATADEAIAELGPTFGWWQHELAKKDAGSAGLEGKRSTAAPGDVAKKASDLKVPGVRRKTIEHLKAQHGEKWDEEYKKILATGD